MFIVAFTTKSGYILGLGAIYADKSKWIRWFTPSAKYRSRFPGVISYKLREDARAHAASVLRRAKKSGIFSADTKSEIVEVAE